jgi:hypothetical protein
LRRRNGAPFLSPSVDHADGRRPETGLGFEPASLKGRDRLPDDKPSTAPLSINAWKKKKHLDDLRQHTQQQRAGAAQAFSSKSKR